MAKKRSPELLRQLLVSETVVELPRIESALGDVSTVTAFRYLRQVPYRRIDIPPNICENNMGRSKFYP